MATKKLGKGLSALIAEDYSEHSFTLNDATNGEGMNEVSLTAIRSGKFQPRVHFDERYLQELADSIAKSGIMQPIVVRPIDEEGQVRYEIIAGERRWRAAKLAGEITIPAIIRDISDQQALELALIENVQRQDLTPLEEARGYQRLMDEFSYTQEELSQAVGKSRSHIANLLRMLNLPHQVKEMLERGDITMGHARALMNAENPVSIAQEVMRRGLNVRQTENLARAGSPKGDRKPRQGSDKSQNVANSNYAPMGEKSADIQALEETLTDSMGLPVSIEESGQRGKVSIMYESLEQLDMILRRIGTSTEVF